MTISAILLGLLLAQSGGISGSVVDAMSGLPLPGALVVAEPEGPAALPAEAGELLLAPGRATRSNGEGRYAFASLPDGRYRLRVSRIGYRSATVMVEFRGGADSNVSLGLTVEPVMLEPVVVQASAPLDSARDAWLPGAPDDARVRSARARQAAHLASDVRALTQDDLLEAVTLGETDLFRALHRAPGVTTRDDYSAHFWVRGARWDQTRVLFDGLPLFNPVHAFGLLSAVNPDAVAGAFLHPGVRSASFGDGAAGVLDVTSRAGRAGESLQGVAELSLVDSRLALDGGNDRASWLIAGRRSWLDLALDGYGLVRGFDDPFPYSFSDVTGRFDLVLGGGWSLVTSGMREIDVYDEHRSGLGWIGEEYTRWRERKRGVWGNDAGRITLARASGGLVFETTLGGSRFHATHDLFPFDSADPGGSLAPRQALGRERIAHLALLGKVAPATTVPPAWRAGYALVREGVAYGGPTGYVNQTGTARDADPWIDRNATSTRAVLWGDRRWGGDLGWSLETGLRLELGSEVLNAGPVRAAPHVIARFAPTSDLSFSAGAGRSYQHIQAVGETGPTFEDYAAYDIWVLADRTTPIVQSDAATVGMEWWAGGPWLLGANAYLRRSDGIALMDPAPGRYVERPLFASGSNTARGLELSARRLAGRWTGAAAYTLARSENRVGGITYAPREDRRHAVDLTAMVRASSSWRFGSAFSFASGAPYTQVYATCDGLPREVTGLCDFDYVLEPPGSRRERDYASLDLLVDWTRRHERWDWGLYLQVRNVLGRENPAAYEFSTLRCAWRALSDCDGSEPIEDEWRRSIHMPLPLIGFRARF